MGNRTHERCERCGGSLRGPVRRERANNGHHYTVWECPSCDREVARG